MLVWDRNQWFCAACLAGYRLHGLVKLSGLSLRQLERHLRKQFGRSPEEWLNEQRMVAAPHFLRAGHSVKAVAIELGYRDPAHFCHHFKATHGLAPGHFIEKFSRCRAGAMDVALMQVKEPAH